jgi:hypothetical protein
VSHGRRYSSCAYKGAQGLATTQIERWPSSKALRSWIRRKGKTAGWRPVSVGDVGILFSRGGHAVVQVALGRQRLSITVHAGSAASLAVQLATEAIPEVR